MKKIIVMLTMVIMSFAFAVSVMAAPSPEDDPYDEPSSTTSEQEKTQEKIDKKTQIVDDDDEFYDGKDGKNSDNGNGDGSSKTTTSVTSSTTSSSPKTGDQGAPVTLVYASLAAAALAVYAAKHVKEQY